MHRLMGVHGGEHAGVRGCHTQHAPHNVPRKAGGQAEISTFYEKAV